MMDYGGYTIYKSAVLTEEIMLKKQTMKFKNRRWVKKYRKKYLRTVPSRKITVNNLTKEIYGHPIVIDTLVREIENRSSFVGNPVFDVGFI